MTKSRKHGGYSDRDAKTGRFTTAKKSKQNPDTTLREMRGGKPTGSARSAKSGKFVSSNYARRNPRTTVKES